MKEPKIVKNLIEREKKLFGEFKAFALKGNVVDMAIGVIIGGAFGKIVTSLVNDLLMPMISVLTGRVSLVDLAFSIPHFDYSYPPIAINYGQFLQNTLDFFIIALSIFFMVKLVSGLHRKYAATHVLETPPPTKEEELLTEIRDLLKERSEV